MLYSNLGNLIAYNKGIYKALQKMSPFMSNESKTMTLYCIKMCFELKKGEYLAKNFRGQ